MQNHKQKVFSKAKIQEMINRMNQTELISKEKFELKCKEIKKEKEEKEMLELTFKPSINRKIFPDSTNKRNEDKNQASNCFVKTISRLLRDEKNSNLNIITSNKDLDSPNNNMLSKFLFINNNTNSKNYKGLKVRKDPKEINDQTEPILLSNYPSITLAKEFLYSQDFSNGQKVKEASESRTEILRNTKEYTFHPRINSKSISIVENSSSNKISLIERLSSPKKRITLEYFSFRNSVLLNHKIRGNPSELNIKKQNDDLILNLSKNLRALHKKSNSISIQPLHSEEFVKKSKNLIEGKNKIENFKENDKNKSFIIESLLAFAKSSLIDIDSLVLNCIFLLALNGELLEELKLLLNKFKGNVVISDNEFQKEAENFYSRISLESKVSLWRHFKFSKKLEVSSSVNKEIKNDHTNIESLQVLITRINNLTPK